MVNPIAFALLSLTIITGCWGADMKPVPVSRVGYIRADADPASQACHEWAPLGSGVAWDYGNRSLVVELPRPHWVTDVVVVSDMPGSGTPHLSPETISLYTSMDNRRYDRYTGPCRVRVVRSEQAGELWRVEVSGIELFTRYLKLKQTYNGADYGFGISKLEQAVKVSSSDPLDGPVSFAGFSVAPAQRGGSIVARVLVTAPSRPGLSLELEAENCETWEHVAVTCTPEPGKWVPVRLDSPRLVAGGYWLTARLKVRTAIVALETTCVRLHTSVLGDDEVAAAAPPPGGALILRDLPQWCEGAPAFDYSLPGKTPQAGRGVALPQGGQLTIKSPVAGECAVYVAAESPWPALSVQWGGRRETIAAAQADWERRGGFQELFVGYGDFAAAPLVVKSPQAPCKLSHIRIARLSPEEATLAHHQNDPTHNRRVIYNNDGFSELWGVKNWDRARLLQLVERYQGTDTEFFEMACLVSGWVNYPSKFATFYQPGDVPDDQWVRANDKMAAELFVQLERDGLPIYPTLVARGKEIGVPVWGSLRMSGYYGFQEQQTMQPFNGKLWHEHPEMRIRNRDGRSSTNMSFAWEPVRQQRIGVLGELAEMGCAGVMMDFCRYPDILGYDEPFVQGFKAKYGVSPLELADNDERWITYRCEMMNDFFRAVRKHIDEIGRRQGRQIRISVRVPATGYREYGFDPATWAREHLMDILIPHYPGLERDFDTRPWVAMAHPHGVLVYPGIEVTKTMTSNTELTDAEIKRGVKPGIVTAMSQDDYRRRVWRRYREGADGTFLFNIWTVGYTRNLLGDKESLRKWSTFEDPLNQPWEAMPAAGAGTAGTAGTAS